MVKIFCWFQGNYLTILPKEMTNLKSLSGGSIENNYLIKSLTKSKTYSIKFNLDGEVCEGNFIYGMITNTRRVGGFELPIISDFMLDDGLIDVTLVKKPDTADEATKLINALITQQPDGKTVLQYRVSKLDFECDGEIPWTLDGEFGGSYKEQSVELKKQFLRMVY